MSWLIAGVLIALAVYSKRFRIFALGAIGVVGLLLFAWNSFNNREREAAKRLVPASDVQIDDARLGGRGGSYQFTARVRNANASHPLSSLDLKVTLRDCQPSGPCEVVGESTTSVYARVPPGQARDVDDYVFFSPSPSIRGRMEWSYRIEAISAEK
jgi:hypothetical protein